MKKPERRGEPRHAPVVAADMQPAFELGAG